MTRYRSCAVAALVVQLPLAASLVHCGSEEAASEIAIAPEGGSPDSAPPIDATADDAAPQPPCGAAGEPCCKPGDTCTTGQCGAGAICEACGGAAQVCCAAGLPDAGCDDGGACIEGACCPAPRACAPSEVCCPADEVCAPGGGVCCAPDAVCRVGGVPGACCGAPQACVNDVCQ